VDLVTDGRRVLPFARRQTPQKTPARPPDWLDQPSGLTIDLRVRTSKDSPDHADAPPRPRSE
jgi:hypothetical protein